MGKSLDSSCIAFSFRTTLSVRLVIIGTIVVIVPFFMLLLFKALALLTSVFNSASCTSDADDVVQISIILVSSSVMFLRWSEITCDDATRKLSYFNTKTLTLNLANLELGEGFRDFPFILFQSSFYLSFFYDMQ
jgi:hypothetical protein